MAKRVRRPAVGLSEELRRYIPKGIDQRTKPMQTAKLFKNGRSQAVRLPKDFRFDGDEVYVRREGDSVILSPKEARGDPWKDLFEAFAMYDPRYPIERHQPKEQQVRKSIEDWGLTKGRRRARPK